MANTTSVIVSELALASFLDRDQENMKKALNKSMGEARRVEGGFSQISIILYPSGKYYASTNSDFHNKKVGQSLLEKIKSNVGSKTTVEKLYYKTENRTIPVLQFLRNITFEEKKVAVTQILFDYEEILNGTRNTLLLVGGIFLLAVVILIWLMYIPITRTNDRLIGAFEQINKKNFAFSLSTVDKGETRILFDAFNNMVAHLQDYFLEKQRSQMDSVFKNEGDSPSREISLRKAKITCLCARIPRVQDTIENDSPDFVAETIAKFLEPFEKIIQEYGGQVIKILGDKIYVMFEGINSIDNSIRTALKLNQSWQVINHENKVLDRKQQNFGIGLHSTEGVAGIMGQASLSYTFVGEAASVAEYLCSCAKNAEILISSSMMDQTNSIYQHQIATNLKPTGISDIEEFLAITSIQSFDESLFNPQMDSVNVTDDASELENSSNESSIPDMLEETLSSAPLETVLSNKFDYEKSTVKKESGKKQSLWDEFDSKK